MEIKNLSVVGSLQNVDVKFEKGKITNLLGENGSGKTTLVRCIADLDLYNGEIIIEDEGVVSLVFQNPNYQFVRNIVEDDLAFSLEKFNMSRKDMKKEILNISEQFYITDLLNKSVSDLSGGQKQKVSLASNILLKPKVLLLDESFEMVDINSTVKILDKIREYVKRENIVCIHVTHNTDLISESDDVLYLKNKHIYYKGSVEEFWREAIFKKNIKIKVPFYKRLERATGIKVQSIEELKDILCKLN